MHRSNFLALIISSTVILGMSGCGSSSGGTAEVSPTAAPTPSIVPVIISTAPTSTPTPEPTQMILGQQDDKAASVCLSNNLQESIKELYLRISGSSDKDWGENLISSKSGIKSSEQVQLYYEAFSSDSSKSKKSSKKSVCYDMKIVTARGSTYEIYTIQFSDMEKAFLLLDKKSSSAYLRYMSLSSKKETDTRGNTLKTATPTPKSAHSSQSSSEDDSSYDDTDYDSSSSGSSGNTSSTSSSAPDDTSGDNTGDNTGDYTGDYSYDDDYEENWDEDDRWDETDDWNEDDSWNETDDDNWGDTSDTDTESTE